jgi:hypothetical protein
VPISFSMKRFTTCSSAFYDKAGVDKRELSGIRFLLCQGCLWCASFIGIREPMITQCPSCNSVGLESMPISEKEAYSFIRCSIVSLENGFIHPTCFEALRRGIRILILSFRGRTINAYRRPYEGVEFIHNIRRNANRRKKMFESILIGS